MALEYYNIQFFPFKYICTHTMGIKLMGGRYKKEQYLHLYLVPNPSIGKLYMAFLGAKIIIMLRPSRFGRCWTSPTSPRSFAMRSSSL